MTGKWQPISEAPRDGTVVLGWFGNSTIPYAESIYWSFGLWVWSHDGDSPSEGNEPTHFMPLPDQPEDE